MKVHLFLFSVFLSLFFSRTAAAQVVTPYDSLAIDSSITTLGVQNPQNVYGKPDKSQAQLSSSSVLTVQFAAGGNIVTLQKNAPLHFYWIRETADSCGMDIQFMYFGFNGGVPRFGPIVRVMETGPLEIPNETTINVPDTGYNALQITIAADSGASTAYLDAITLIQGGTAGIQPTAVLSRALLTNYPNPFEHSVSTTVHIDAPTAGQGMLLISDALGREIEQVPLGMLNGGEQETKVQLETAGVFFARLVIDGNTVGAPLKLIAE